jgi:uncharacterized phage protein gp47/JayE
MAYTPPSVGPAGLSVPTFQDIQENVLTLFLSIYGATNYLGNDSPDYQWISAFCLKLEDVMLAIQLAYASRSPLTAIGYGLDAVVKINGLVRKPASFSTATLTVTGTIGAVISNGVARDINGFLWNLPTSVTIPGGGTINVTGTSQVPGMITASASQINVIATPTAGWNSVTNASAAVPGLPIESDALLRARQSISVALPSSTRLEGTVAAIAGLPGVTRYNVVENYLSITASHGVAHTSGTTVILDTGYPVDSSDVGQTININGTTYTIASIVSTTQITIAASAGTQTGVPYFIGDGTAMGPEHSITSVVEGGTDDDIAQAIYDNKSIGCLANGTVTVSVSDPTGSLTIPISFDRVTYNQIWSLLLIQPLAGYTSETTLAIRTAVTAYLNSLQIGQPAILSEFYGAALTARPNPDQPLFSIRSLYIGTTISSILTATVGSSGGTGYAANDILTVVQSGASGGTVKVTAAPGGVVTAISVTPPSGTGYSIGTNLATTGGTGSGCTVNITATAPNATSDIPINFDGVALGILANCAVALV